MQPSFFEPRPKWEPIVLRPYQREAVDAVYNHLRTRDDNPCVVIPTGGGKTPVIATICRDVAKTWGGRVLVLARVKELLEQTADKLRRVCPDVPVGIYSAGLGRKDTKQKVIVAGIQSIYKQACDLDPFDIVIIDEAQDIPPEGDGMYRQLLADERTINPNVRLVGFTATPFRLKSGSICTPDGFLNSICYEIGVRQMIVDGFLCPLVSKAGKVLADMSQVHVRAGEFVAAEAEQAMDTDIVVSSACAEIVAHALAENRKACLLFCAGVDHAKHVVATLAKEHGSYCGLVTGSTPDEERAIALEKFKTGDMRYLANVNVLTTGFDAPNIDLVALLRPTMSPGLYYQMVGRGFRLHEGKPNCLILDFGGNVIRHGPVDQIVVEDAKRKGPGGEAPAKECPECHAVIACGYASCPECGYEFPPPESSQHEPTASNAGVLSGQVSLESFPITSASYQVWKKRYAAEDAPRTLRVDYHLNLNEYKSEWICLEHEGWARKKADAWWKARSSDPVPQTIEQAVEIAQAGGLADTLEITVRKVAGEKYDSITDYRLDEIPAPTGLYWEDEPADDEGMSIAAQSAKAAFAEEDIPF